MFEVSDTIAIFGMWDPNTGHYAPIQYARLRFFFSFKLDNRHSMQLAIESTLWFSFVPWRLLQYDSRTVSFQNMWVNVFKALTNSVDLKN